MVPIVTWEEISVIARLAGTDVAAKVALLKIKFEQLYPAAFWTPDAKGSPSGRQGG